MWTRTPAQGLPLSLVRLFDPRTLNQINAGSSLIAAVLAVLLIATAPEEFGVPECSNTMEAAGFEGPHRWGIILPNSSRVPLLTNKAIVAARYPELVLHDHPNRTLRCSRSYGGIRRIPHCPLGCTEGSQNSSRRCSSSPNLVKTRERRGSSFSQLGLEPNHTGLTAQSLFFLEESCRVKRSDTQTFSNFSNYFKRVLKLQKRSSSFSK